MKLPSYKIYVKLCSDLYLLA